MTKKVKKFMDYKRNGLVLYNKTNFNKKFFCHKIWYKNNQTI